MMLPRIVLVFDIFFQRLGKNRLYLPFSFNLIFFDSILFEEKGSKIKKFCLRSTAGRDKKYSHLKFLLILEFFEKSNNLPWI